MGKGKENQGNQNIAVYVRCRPLNSQEKKVSSASVVEMNCERREVKIDKLQKTLTFDRVFDGSSSQVDLYKVVVSPMLEEVLAGYSCTVFAYGQTGTGKTYTMEGERSCRRETSWEEDPSSGIVPRAMHHLFETLREQGLDYSLRVSFLELYNEELFDLLAPLDDASKIRLYDDPIRKGSVIVNGIEEVAVHSRDEVYAILERGTQKRQTAMTLMNANSSRSHTVFSITVHIKENNLEGEELMKTGKLNLVDLAGSENVGRSGAVDKRAREAGNINQSLLTLGRVITALVERSPHIPYRESKLTRLLQDSLGGKTKTSIIATISPASINIEETLSTLDYANRAKNIMNKPETNQRLTKKTLLKQYTEEIERLRRDLTAAREKNGVYMDPEDYNRMTKTIDELEQRLKALTEEFEKLNEMFAKTKLDLEERDSQLTETQTNLRSTRTTLESTVVVLNKTTQDRDERNVILDARAKTEKSLTDQAKQLIDVADVATSDIPQLHDKIHRKQTVEDYNREKKDNYHSEAKHLTEKLSLYSKQKHDDESTFLQSIIASLDEQLAKSTSELQSSRTLISKFEECIFNTISLLNTVLAEQAKESTEAIERTTQAKKSRSNDFSTKLVSNLKLQLEQLISSSINDNVKISDSIRIANTEIIKKVEQLQNSLSSKLQEQLCQLEVFEKNFNELYQVQKVGTESTQSQIKHIAQMDNERYSIFQNLVALLSSNGANLQSQLAGFLSDVANLQSINDSDRQNRHSELEMVSQGVKTYDNHSTSMKSQIQNYSTNQATSFRGLDKEVLSSAKTIIDSTEELMNEFKVSATEALTKMNDLKHEVHLLQTFVKEEMENDVQCIEKESLLQLEINQAAREQQLEKIQILSDTTKANTNSQYEFFEMTKTQSCDFIISQKEIVHKEVEKSNKNRELGNQIVNEMDEALDTYFKNYRDDVPSGATPNRRQFNYPKTLAATSPEDRIIERHRKQMKLNLRVIEDEDSIDEIASDSSEASCLNSSIASSLRSISNQNLSDMDESKENQLPLVDENIFKKPEAEKKTTGTIPRIIKRPLRSKNVDSS